MAIQLFKYFFVPLLASPTSTLPSTYLTVLAQKVRHHLPSNNSSSFPFPSIAFGPGTPHTLRPSLLPSLPSTYLIVLAQKVRHHLPSNHLQLLPLPLLGIGPGGLECAPNILALHRASHQGNQSRKGEGIETKSGVVGVFAVGGRGLGHCVGHGTSDGII